MIPHAPRFSVMQSHVDGHPLIASVNLALRADASIQHAMVSKYFNEDSRDFDKRVTD